MTEKRFKVSNGVLYEYNSLIDAWNTVDMEKLCMMLNKIHAIFYEFLEDMWLK